MKAYLGSSAIWILLPPTLCVSALVLTNSKNVNPITLQKRSWITRLESKRVARDDIAPSKFAKVDLESLASLNTCESGTKARRLLRKILLEDRDSQSQVLYGSVKIPPGASSWGISDGDLAIQTRLLNSKYSIMDVIELSGNRDADRASLSLLCLMVASTISAIIANQHLPGPEILRFMVVWLFCFSPFIFVGYGIATPEKLQAFLVSVQRELFPAYRQRMLQHEAGHFLMGHLLGLPVAGYQANAVKNAVNFYPLADTDRSFDLASQLGFDKSLSARRVEQNSEALSADQLSAFDAPFFSETGRGAWLVEERSVFRNAQNYTNNPFLKLASRNEPSNSWPFRGFDEATLDQLSAISVAGVCSEILAFGMYTKCSFCLRVLNSDTVCIRLFLWAIGNAEGGVADLNQLRQIYRSAEPSISERDEENRIRFALGYTMSQLRRHLGALDALSKIMERDGTIAECVAAIENCENMSGVVSIAGENYEVQRRKDFLSDQRSPLERLFLGGGRTIDELEDRLVEGKGGGYRKETFRLTGDDPVYAAIAVALLFALWASAGGLSLH
jgi:hypothetical protein